MDILLASNNKNKYIELQNIFKNSNSKYNLVSSEDIPNVLEDRKSIEENAQKKAEECYKKFKNKW